MNTIIKQLNTCKAMLLYLFFGGCTTAINLVVYCFCYTLSGIANVPSTVIAWFMAVVFAYITNKLFVFQSKAFKPDLLLREIISFFGCRGLTGILDVIIMLVAVDVMAMNATLWKLVSNLLVISLNYAASKRIIFKTR